jgi:hypothetical protein
MEPTFGLTIGVFVIGFVVGAGLGIVGMSLFLTTHKDKDDAKS